MNRFMMDEEEEHQHKEQMKGKTKRTVSSNSSSRSNRERHHPLYHDDFLEIRLQRKQQQQQQQQAATSMEQQSIMATLGGPRRGHTHPLLSELRGELNSSQTITSFFGNGRRRRRDEDQHHHDRKRRQQLRYTQSDPDARSKRLPHHHYPPPHQLEQLHHRTLAGECGDNDTAVPGESRFPFTIPTKMSPVTTTTTRVFMGDTNLKDFLQTNNPPRIPPMPSSSHSKPVTSHLLPTTSSSSNSRRQASHFRKQRLGNHSSNKKNKKGRVGGGGVNTSSGVGKAHSRRGILSAKRSLAAAPPEPLHSNGLFAKTIDDAQALVVTALEQEATVMRTAVDISSATIGSTTQPMDAAEHNNSIVMRDVLNPATSDDEDDDSDPTQMHQRYTGSFQPDAYNHHLQQLVEAQQQQQQAPHQQWSTN